MKNTYTIRTDRLAMVVAIIEFSFGLGIYAAPAYFANSIYAGLVPHFSLFASVMLAGGAVLFLQSRYRFPRLWERLLYLIPAGAMGWLDLHFALSRNWPFVSAVTMLALGTLLIPWLPRRDGAYHRVIGLWLVVFGLAEIATGALMLAAPSMYQLPEFQGLVPHLHWMGVLGAVGGLVLLVPSPHRPVAADALRWLCGAAFVGLFGWFIGGPAGTIILGAWLSGFLVFCVPIPHPIDTSKLFAKPADLLGDGAVENVSAYQEIHSWILILVVVIASAALPDTALQPPLAGVLFVVLAAGCNLVLNWLLVPLLSPERRFYLHTVLHIALLGLLFVGAGPVMQPLVVAMFIFPVHLMIARGITSGRTALAIAMVMYVGARAIHDLLRHGPVLATTGSTLLFALVLMPIGELVFRLLQLGSERADALRRRLDQSAMLARISAAIHNSLEIEQILVTTAQELGEAMKASYSFIFTEPAYTDTPFLYWTQGMVRLYSDPNRDLFEYLTSKVREDRLTAISDLRAEPRQTGPGSAGEQRALESGVRSLLVAPVSLGGKLVGFIGCTVGPECRTWLPEERSFLEAVSLEVGNALSHAQAHRELAYMADHDSLTGLINRRRFRRRLEFELLRCGEPGVRGALLFLDLDQFKYVNDTMGHPAGDALLVGLASELSEAVGNGQVLARLGGDEFVVLMPGADQAAAETLAAGIRELVHRHTFQVGARTLSVTVSVGVALYPEHGCAVDDLLARADIAVYQAKELGRDRYQVYRADTNGQDAMKEQVDLVQRIRAALAEHRLVAYSQPILHLSKQRVTAHELLVRMVDEEGRVHPPGDFLDAAERSGLIREIDRWMIAQAVELVQQNQQAGVARQVHVNLSGKTLTDPGLLPFVQERLQAAAIDPKSLVFEITETVIISDMTRALAHIETLRALGCRFALDDFGSGFSSFSHLLSLPLDHIKIDGRFVQDLNRSERSQAFVRAVVELGQSLGMEMTAEFVEQEETARLLHTYGVDYAQGYLIGRPQPVPVRPTAN